MTRLGSHSMQTILRGAFGALVVMVCGMATLAGAQAPPQMDPISFSAPDATFLFSDITIDQNLNAQIDMDLTFMSSVGNEVSLRDVMDDRPAILAFVYYDCPSLCKAELEGLEIVIKAMKYAPGQDYNIITVSIDPDDSVESARTKKSYHVGRVARDGVEEGWKFLTGQDEKIKALAETVGFKYRYDPDQDIYAHAGGIMVLTPEGKIARYYYGTEYIKRDVEFGLMEASEGRIGSVVDKVLILCFKYDPAAGGYGLMVFRTLKALSTLLILGFAGMYLIFFLRMRKKQRKAETESIVHGAQGSAH